LLDKIDQHLDNKRSFSASDFYSLVQVLSNIDSRRSIIQDCLKFIKTPIRKE
jgi:hypothetical protein